MGGAQLIIEDTGGGLISVQAEARGGYVALGLPESGPLDSYAHAAANLLLGNPPPAAALEIVALGDGLTIRFERGGLAAITGADLGANIAGRRVPTWHRLWIRGGETLRFAGRTNIAGNGRVAYLAVAGGLSVPPYLGSSSAYLGAQGALPGLAGRPLQAGDTLTMPGAAGAEQAGVRWPLDEGDAYPGDGSLDILWGPHAGHLGRQGRAALLQQDWQVADGNRMGLRLEGDPLPISGGELASFGVVRGGVQLPAGGLPIVLGPDHQTTGGYPLIAVIARASWPRLGQLLPNAHLRFRLVTIALARVTERERAQRLRQAARLLPHGPELALV